MAEFVNLSSLPVSGFADEIDASFDRQLRVVAELGMRSICLRAADGKNIVAHSVAEVQDRLAPRLQAAGIGVSALGSPIGKVAITDPAAVAKTLERLDDMCRIAKLFGDAKVRVFSFYMPSPNVADEYADRVIELVRQMTATAKHHDVVLVLENEKDTFGDIGRRVHQVLEAVDSSHLGAAFDFANFVQCGDDPVSCWNLLRPRVRDIHIKDARHSDGRNVLCGTGDGQIAVLLADAFQTGYRETLTLEPHLAVFDSLAQLERGGGHDVIIENQYESGADAYGAQLRALLRLVGQIPGFGTDVKRSVA